MIDVAWAAGFLEGDGTFAYTRTPMVAAFQIQKEPVERLARLFGGVIRERRTPKGKIIHVWQIYNRDAAGLMMTVYSLMSPHRKAQIENAIQCWRKTGFHHREKTSCPRGHPYDKFYHAKDPALRVQRYRYCRVCHNAAVQKWAEANPERKREIHTASYERRKAARRVS